MHHLKIVILACPFRLIEAKIYLNSSDFLQLNSKTVSQAFMSPWLRHSALSFSEKAKDKNQG